MWVCMYASKAGGRSVCKCVCATSSSVAACAVAYSAIVLISAQRLQGGAASSKRQCCFIPLLLFVCVCICAPSCVDTAATRRQIACRNQSQAGVVCMHGRMMVWGALRWYAGGRSTRHIHTQSCAPTRSRCLWQCCAVCESGDRRRGRGSAKGLC